MPSKKVQKIRVKNQEFQGKTILLVNSGSIKKKFTAKTLKKLNLQVICLNKEKNWIDPYVDHWILADTANHQESIQAVQTFLAGHPHIKIDGAVTFWEDDVLLTSKITDKLNLIGIPYSIAKKARNKFLFRAFCAENNLPHPRHHLVRSDKDVNFVCRQFAFPLVIKPAYGSSSAYVIKIETKQDLKDAYAYIKKSLSTQIESAITDGSDIVVEEFIDGEEVDIDIVVQSGRIKFHSISDNDKTEEPFFIETGQAIPSQLPPDNQKALFDLADETLEKMNVQNGVIHYEAKMTKNGPVPIEVNLRMGGDEVHSFVKGAWHIDLAEYAARVALGIYFPKIERPAKPFQYLAGRYFLSEHSGILSQLEIDPKLKEKKYIEGIEFFKEVGEPVLTPPEGYEYLGWLTTTGHNQLDAEDNLDEAFELVHFEVSRFHGSSLIGQTERKNRLAMASIKKETLIKVAKIEQLKKIQTKSEGALNLGLLIPAGKEYETPSAKLSRLLSSKGFPVDTFVFENAPKTMEALQKSDVNLIINATANGRPVNSQPLLLLDLLEIPYTGANTFTATLANDFRKVNKLLSFHELPTPEWEIVYGPNEMFDLELSFPILVKKAVPTSGLKKEKAVVVRDKAALLKKCLKITNDFTYPAYLQEYIEGTSSLIPIIGNTPQDLKALPIVIKKDKQTLTLAKLEKKLNSLQTEIALDAFSILGLNDFALIKVTLDKEGNPYITNIHPTPSLLPDNIMPQIAKCAGLSYASLLEKIIKTAIKRYQKKPTSLYLE